MPSPRHAHADVASRRARTPTPPRTGRARPSAPDAAPTPRPPQQARGARRVEAILDAAAALIAESGIAGLTMQAIAERSHTASGSLYHFFPDRDAVLRGLAARHLRGMHDVMTTTTTRLTDAVKAARGRPVPASVLIDDLLDPLISYKTSRPDLGLVEQAIGWPDSLESEHTALMETGRTLTEQFVMACDPGAPPSERLARAAVLGATLQGMTRQLATIADPRARSALLRETKRMLAAYFTSIATPSPRRRT